MVLPIVPANSEISIIRNDDKAILFDLPHGMIDLKGIDAGAMCFKPASILECKYMAVERICAVDSPIQLAKFSAEEKAKKVFLKTIVRQLFTDLSAFSKALPEMDDLSMLSPDEISAFRDLDKELAPSYVKSLKIILQLPEVEQKKLHLANGDTDTFEGFIATLRRTVSQLERFIASSPYKTLYEDLYSRSIYLQHQIVFNALKPLGLEDFSSKVESMMASSPDKSKHDRLDYSTGIQSLVLDNILYSHLGLQKSFVFTEMDQKRKEIVDRLTKQVLGNPRLLSQLPKETTILDLLQFLKAHGPFAAHGWFGKKQYLIPPEIYSSMPKLQDRDVFAWKPGSPRLDRSTLAHCVTVVGAMKHGENALVFFTDPEDASNPADKTAEKVYVISFANFKKNNVEIVYSKDLGVSERA